MEGQTFWIESLLKSSKTLFWNLPQGVIKLSRMMGNYNWLFPIKSIGHRLFTRNASKQKWNIYNHFIKYTGAILPLCSLLQSLRMYEFYNKQIYNLHVRELEWRNSHLGLCWGSQQLHHTLASSSYSGHTLKTIRRKKIWTWIILTFNQ